MTLFGQDPPLKGGLINALGAIVADGSKTQFVSEYLRDTISFTGLCDRYGISRKTGFKWIDRYQAEAPSGWQSVLANHIHLRTKHLSLYG